MLPDAGNQCAVGGTVCCTNQQVDRLKSSYVYVTVVQMRPASNTVYEYDKLFHTLDSLSAYWSSLTVNIVSANGNKSACRANAQLFA